MGSIYKITNIVNGKAYIGKTTRDAVKTRIRDHLRGKGSQPVKDAIEKYGQDAFTYEILHDGILPEFLDTLEKEEIAKFNTVAPHGYNLTEGGDGTLGYRYSHEARRKLSEIRKGEKNHFFGKKHSAEARRKISESGKGRKHSAEARHKISESGKGRKHSAEARRKMSEALKGKVSPMRGKERPTEICRKISKTKKEAFEKRLGMPFLAFHIRINLFLRAGWSFRRIAKGLKIPPATVHKYKNIASLLNKS